MACLDLNRVGTPLLEIVSLPEIHSANQAKRYAKELYLRMIYAGVCEGDLFAGNLRFDVNISSIGIRPAWARVPKSKNLEQLSVLSSRLSTMRSGAR